MLPAELEPEIAQFFFRRNPPHIEITNLCNIACPYCGNPELVSRKGRMQLADLRTVITNLGSSRYTPKVTLCGHGEPFCNPAIYDMIDLITDAKLEVDIQTNGKWPMVPSRLDSLFSAAWIQFTIDGASNAVSQLSRPDTDVDRIYQLIADLVRQRDRRGADTVLSVRMNVFTFNKHEIHPLIRRCVEIGVDHVGLAHGHGTGPPPVMTTVSPRIIDDYPEGYVSMQQGLMDSPPQGAPAAAPENGVASADDPASSFFQRAGCPTLTIRWDGQVTPCCHDNNVSVPLGCLLETPISEILSRENLARATARILEGHEARIESGEVVLCDSCTYLADYLELEKAPKMQWPI